MYKYGKAEQISSEQVKVTLIDDETLDVKRFTWTKDKGQSAQDFIKMVKTEVKIYLDHLNNKPTITDVTEEFRS